MKITLYVLGNSSDIFYVGICTQVERRLTEHNSGKTKTTREKGPWKIVHVEEYDSWSAARTREKFLKSAIGRNWIKNKFSLLKE
jgi:putative endonuclease